MVVFRKGDSLELEAFSKRLYFYTRQHFLRGVSHTPATKIPKSINKESWKGSSLGSLALLAHVKIPSQPKSSSIASKSMQLRTNVNNVPSQPPPT